MLKTRYINRHDASKKKYIPNSSRSAHLVPIGTVVEVGQELRNLIRIVDVRIIGATKNWDMHLKKALVEARLSIGRTPREEAIALSNLVAVVGLHIVTPERWRYKSFSRELIPAVQSAREILGLEVDERFEDVKGSMA